MRIWSPIGLVVLALGLAAVLADRSEQPRAAPAAKAGKTFLRGPCPVTVPGADSPFAREGFNYGNRYLGVQLWPDGKLVAGRLPDGSYAAVIEPDGSITAKLGWWREVEGRLRVRGTRLDRSARPLSADVPDGYPATGFQPTGLTFPTKGCWKVVGSVGSARLSFVVRVTRTAGSS